MEKGTITYDESIGYYIQPESDSSAVVSFPVEIQPVDEKGQVLDYYELPKGFNLGDVVRFAMTPDRIHAANMTKVED